MHSQNLVNYAAKGMQHIEKMFEEKGVIQCGMSLDFHLREYDDEELFDMLVTIDRVHQKIETPCQVLAATVWRKIQSQTTKQRRGYLLRHKFGEMRALHLMRKYSTYTRVIEYWEQIEERIETGVPFWVYEEAAEQDLPAMKAIERVAQYKRQNKNSSTYLTREEIRLEGEQLKIAKRKPETTFDCDDSEPQYDMHKIVESNNKEDSTIGVVYVDTNAIQTVARMSKRERMDTLWDAAPKAVVDDSMVNKTFTIDLPQWAHVVFDVEAAARQTSVSKLVLQVAADFREKQNAIKNANHVEGARP